MGCDIRNQPIRLPNEAERKKKTKFLTRNKVSRVGKKSMNFNEKYISAHKIRMIRDNEMFCSGEELAEWFGNVLPSINIDGEMQDQTNPKGYVMIETNIFFAFYMECIEDLMMECIEDLMIDFLGGVNEN